LYDAPGGNWELRMVKRGTKEQVLVSEALLINRANKHANVQAGGGHLRGMSQDASLDLFREQTKRDDADLEWATPSGGMSARRKALIAAGSVALGAGKSVDIFSRMGWKSAPNTWHAA
jgi:hypothetical protein